jgi:hypothetical protein
MSSRRRRKPPFSAADIERAEREAARNKALIEAGMTFASRKPSGRKIRRGRPRD